MLKYRHSLQSVFALAGGNFLSSALSAVGGLIIARYLGPGETGLFRTFAIPMMYLSFLHLGTFDGLYRQIPYNIGRDLPDEVNRIASASAAWNVGIGFMVSSIFLLLALLSLFKNDMQGVCGWITQIILGWNVFYGGYLGATYRTINHFVILAKILLFQSILTFILVFVVPFTGFYGLCIRVAIPTLIALYLFHKYRPLKIKLSIDLAALKSVIRIGMPLCFWGTLDTSLWVALESTLLLKLGGVKALGLFSVAVVLREGVLVLTRAVNQVLSPRVVESYSRSGSLRVASKQCISFSLILVPSMVVAVILMALSLDYLVPLCIPKYTEGLGIMKVCLWMVVVQTASLPLNALFATGKAWLYGRGVLVGLVCFIAFTSLTTSLLGGVMAIMIGSLIGRVMRVATCYLDLFLQVKNDRILR